MINWKAVKWFREEEFADPLVTGSGKCIDPILLFTLDKMRRESNWPIVPHWKVGGAVDIAGSWGHAENSYHLAIRGCKAVDFHFITKASIREQYNFICHFRFGGIGFYPEWNFPGFHVDMRPRGKTQHWVKKGGEYVYFFIS